LPRHEREGGLHTVHADFVADLELALWFIGWHMPSDRLSDGENICDLGRECEAQGGSAWMQGPFSWPEIVNKHLIVERFFAPADE